VQVIARVLETLSKVSESVEIVIIPVAVSKFVMKAAEYAAESSVRENTRGHAVFVCVKADV